MSVDTFLERLDRAVSLEGSDAAIRITAEYRPQAGPDAKVFPSTYAPATGSRYHFEQRWDRERQPVEVVVIDSYQSQANRAEAALKRRARELNLPELVIEIPISGQDRSERISSLDAPHRSRDAYFLDGEVDGEPFDQTEIGRELLAVTSPDNATPFLRYAPYDLVYGVWDSHRGNRTPLRFPRAYSAEMIGWHVLRGGRAATKGDPLNLPADTVDHREWRSWEKEEQTRLSTIGHGQIPGDVRTDAGGVSVRSIRRDAVLSLTSLARYSFPSDRGDVTVEGRTCLAALGLLADRVAFGGAGLHLRSGCDLVLLTETLEWVQRGDATEPFELGVGDAEALLIAARDRLARAGLEWPAEPLKLQPTARLQQVVDRAFAQIEIAPEDE